MRSIAMRSLAAALALSLLGLRAAGATPYVFTEVAQTEADLSASDYVVNGPALNNAGTVAFRHVAGGVEGVYTKAVGGPLVPVATTAGGVFNRFSTGVDLNDSGAVAFHAMPAGGGEGIYFAPPGGPIETVAATAGGVFTGFRTGEYFRPLPSVNNAGVVVAAGILPGFRQALLRYENGVLTTPVVASEIALPDINSRGDIAFKQTQYELHLRNAAGGLTRIAQDFGQRGVLEMVSINDNGVVAHGYGFPGHSIHLYDNGRYFEVRVLSWEAVEGGLTLNNRGDIAFIAVTGNRPTYSIFAGPINAVEKVIGVGDPLLGSTVDRLGFSREGFNDAGQIAFWVQLADGRRVIALASPVPEPTTAGALLVLTGAGLLARRRRA